MTETPAPTVWPALRYDDAPAAIRFLLHELPVKGPTPLYILPEDARQDTAYFTPHTSS